MRVAAAGAAVSPFTLSNVVLWLTLKLQLLLLLLPLSLKQAIGNEVITSINNSILIVASGFFFSSLKLIRRYPRHLVINLEKRVYVVGGITHSYIPPSGDKKYQKRLIHAMK